MGNVPEYYDRILNGVAAFIPEDCEYLGGFLCQGKMPIQVRKRYEAMQNTSNTQQVEMLLHLVIFNRRLDKANLSSRFKYNHIVIPGI